MEFLLAGKIDFWRETEALEQLYQRIINEQYIRRETVDFWHHSFVEWMKKNGRGTKSFSPSMYYIFYLELLQNT
jgi:hypothetical protein